PLTRSPGAFAAVQLLELRTGAAGLVQAPVVFVLSKRRQHMLPAPGVVAGELRPLVVVARLAAHVNHAVDARAPAQRLATRVAQLPAVQAGIGLGLVQPVGARVANAI